MNRATVDDWRDGGQFLQLSDGLTYWRREGAADGVPLVLVHGATVPSWEFDAVVPSLLRAGFQTLRFDLYGHGASDRPRGEYSFERFKRQVLEVIDASGFPRPAILLGHSFGAALAAAVAAERPECVKRLVLVAPMLDFSSRCISSAFPR
jgi:pimeloyl-ACP methyl ester carboxylesterase